MMTDHARPRRDRRRHRSSQRCHQRGLVFLNNRHYDPTTGVFISVDPLVTTTGEPYIYGAANPIYYSDPTGETPCAFRACPDGIPVVHYDQHDIRSWVWPLVKFVEPDPVDGGIGDTLDETGSRQVPYSFAKEAHDYFTQVPGPGGRLTSDDLKLIAFRPWEESGPATFTLGINTGLCIFLVPCLEFGTSGEGLYIKWGVGVAIDGPGLVIEGENPDCGNSETNAYVGLGGGPVSFGGEATRPSGSTVWDGGPGVGIELPDGGALPAYKGVGPEAGVVHRWAAC